MTLAQLEHAQKRMQQKWYDLVMAEQRGASVQVLERMYNSYVLAMEEYNRCSAEHSSCLSAQPGSPIANNPATWNSGPLSSSPLGSACPSLPIGLTPLEESGLSNLHVTVLTHSWNSVSGVCFRCAA